MAEALFKKKTQDRADLKSLSAGLQAALGTKANPMALTILKKEEIDFSFFRSQPVTPDLMRDATVVFAMTREHLRSLSARYPGYQRKIFLMNETDRDIIDPIGGTLETYKKCSEIIQSCLQRVLTIADLID